ncbi:hypothetical protein FAIPA1_420027 [Frankia sp. AiPs1]
MLPLLYLHGLSSGDFMPALEQFLGSGAGLSASGPSGDRGVETLTAQRWAADGAPVLVRDRGQPPPRLKQPRYPAHGQRRRLSGDA